MKTSIAIVADYDSASRSHRATEEALAHSAQALGLTIEPSWVPTPDLAAPGAVRQLHRFQGIWIGPGSPYISMDGALAAIRFARETNVPLLGTCGGFQHIILEQARNVLGITEAEHEESAPGASRFFISRLACSLVGRTMPITLAPGSRLEEIYAKPVVQEEYLCNFGVNPEVEQILRSSPLRIAGSDPEGAIRAVELPQNRFFIGTLFLPQHRSDPANPHPLISAFAKAASDL